MGYRKIIFLEGDETKTQKGYISMLKKLHEESREHLWFVDDDSDGDEVLFMQDGASVHGKSDAAAPQKWMRANEIDYLWPWSARSPDLNPIERMWAIVKPRVADRFPDSDDDVVAYTIEEFNKVPVATVNALVMSFERRLKSCIRNNGVFMSKV